MASVSAKSLSERSYSVGEPHLNKPSESQAVKPCIRPKIRCGDCNREMETAKKVHRGLSYCPTCYVRLFKRRVCSGCGDFSRLPVFDANATCRQCELKKPCVRCKRIGLKVGKLTPNGPACAACAHYFRVPEACEHCSKPSSRLVRQEIHGQVLRCCPSCISKATTSTCSGCLRPRVIVSIEGPPLCKRCFSLGETPCPICAALMPAGRLKSCMQCYWDGSFQKRLDRLQAGIAAPKLQESVAAFAIWLKARRGAQYAALNLSRYLPFLEAIHGQWIEIPDYADLVAHFGAEGLRRVRSVVIWLQESGRLHVDISTRERTSESRRIVHLLGVLPDGPGRDALQGYHHVLQHRLELGQLQQRSMRIALSSAVRLLLSTDTAGQRLPSQRDLLQLLRKRPGLVASLYGFVGYLNQWHSLGLSPRVDPNWLVRAANTLRENRLLELYAKAGSGEAYERRWISTALTCFHGLGRVGMNTFQYTSFEHEGCPGFNVLIRGTEYWVLPLTEN